MASSDHLAPGSGCYGPDETAQKSGMKSAQENILVRSTACKNIPQHHAHPATIALVALFTGDHAQNAAPIMRPLLNVPRDEEDQLSQKIVVGDRSAGRPKMAAEVLAGYAFEDGGHGSGFGGAVGGAYSILI
jgi:hypothetical protein